MGCGCNKNKDLQKSKSINETPKFNIPSPQKSCSGSTPYNPPRKSSPKPSTPKSRFKNKGLKIR